MSDENSTHFQFRLGGIELEISGERAFVEKMYERVMRDIELARKKVAKTEAAKEGVAATDAEREGQILWVHRCSPMMHKIYMSSPPELDRCPLLKAVDTAALSVVFVEKGMFELVLPKGGKGNTLWAELTEKGRQKIAEAAPEG